MKFNNYQKAAASTAIYPGRDEMAGLVYCALGLASEAGEVASKVKKILRDAGGELSPGAASELATEAGDVLWYLAELSSNIGVPLSLVAKWNLEKLASRKQRGEIKGSGDNR